MKTYVTEMDTFAPELRRTLEATRRALPAAEARARMYVQAGPRAAASDEAASASAAYGLAAATIEACEQMLSRLDDSRPYWEVILPTASGEDGVSPVYHDDSRLYAYYPSGRMVRLRARLSDLRDFTIIQVEAADGRSLGSGHIREAARAAARAAVGSRE